MKKFAVILLGCVAAAGGLRAAESARPGWAYAVPGPGDAEPPFHDDGRLYSLPGSRGHFSYNKIQGRRDGTTPVRVQPADWYPADHPAMPKIVAEGDNARGITACSLCHYPNGRGRPQNAGLAGLPADYIVHQLHDMRDDLRASSEPRKVNAQQMIGFAKGMTEPEIAAAAAYFSAIKFAPWIKVVETDTVPKARSSDGMWLPLEGAKSGREPIAGRIIEVPMDTVRTETLRDSHSGFIAYVPPGAVARGRRIAATGDGGKTLACAICHGEHLEGTGPIPAIAGRDPNYIARQLYDIQKGARQGMMTRLMKPVVAKLDGEDIVDIAAYVASLPPK
jgi:cytochrome c553